MTLRFYQLPFVITLIAMPINWIVGFSGIGIVNWVPEIFGVLLLAAFISNKPDVPLFSLSHIIIFLLFLMHCLYQVLSGKGVGSGAVLSVMLMVLLFISFFKMAPSRKLSIKIISQVSAIYIIHISFIVIEVMLIETGNTNIFGIISGGTYKANLPDSYVSVPQSIYKQSQAASQLCIFAITWFLMLYLSRKKLLLKLSPVQGVVVFTAFFLLIAYPNTTALIVGGVLLFSSVFVLPMSKNHFFRLVFLLVSLVFFDPIYQFFTYKMNINIYGWGENYINAFYNPIELYFKQTLVVQLWGAGSMKSVSQAGLEHADFGLGVSILQMGIIPIGVACLIIFILFAQTQCFSRNKFFDNPQCTPWVWLASINALLVVGNLLSLVHYTVALQTGGRALFSFHIAITIFSLQQLVLYRKNAKYKRSVS